MRTGVKNDPSAKSVRHKGCFGKKKKACQFLIFVLYWVYLDDGVYRLDDRPLSAQRSPSYGAPPGGERLRRGKSWSLEIGSFRGERPPTWEAFFVCTRRERGDQNGAYEVTQGEHADREQSRVIRKEGRATNGNYDPQDIEPRWQKAWAQAELYGVDLDRAADPYYNLMEFPYPSSEGLHVGHFYSYAGADTYGRYQRMRGHDVFQPMGFDAFGIHAENYALKRGINPALLVPQNVRRYREEQLKRMGAAFDWSREVNTTDPRYYRWTQWIFVQLYRGGLAYRATAPVNWCPSCLTTLADEQVIDERCERCDTTVTRRMLTQWFFRITAYAERLLDFSGADWPETTRRLQTHWIGRAEGAEIEFPMAEPDAACGPLTVFSTRPETLYGATFLALAPEHPDAIEISAPGCRSAVEAYVRQVAGRNVVERMALDRTKTGVFTGAWVTNPVDGRSLPVWVADYVVSGHGSGAIFATPAHDQRDWEFARAYDLPIRVVVRPNEGNTDEEAMVAEAAYEGDGIMVHSGPYSGMTVPAARQALVADLQAHGAGRSAVTYRLRDWLISRQRYWGPPIPIVYCEQCGEMPVPEAQLPVLLPAVEEFRPLGTGQSPLASLPDFVQTRCPRCGGPARRETDVSDNFLDSAWYFMRYVSTEYDDRPWSIARLKRWLPVNMYIGGIEHSTLHHLYARFVWKALQDLGHIPRELGPEPFRRLRLHGLVIKDAKKMSKSRGNVVNPDAYVSRYGADVLRIYMLFMAPFEEGGDFRDSGINGIVRFLSRAHRTVAGRAPSGAGAAAPLDGKVAEAAIALERALQRTIREVTDDIETLSFNTAIAALMSFTNVLVKWQRWAAEDVWASVLRRFILLLAPMAPHLAEELWAERGEPFSVHQQSWPEWDSDLVAEEMITLVVQVNGRVRARIMAPATLGQEEARALALADEGVRRHLGVAPVRQAIYVPGRLINLVTG